MAKAVCTQSKNSWYDCVLCSGRGTLESRRRLSQPLCCRHTHVLQAISCIFYFFGTGPVHRLIGNCCGMLNSYAQHALCWQKVTTTPRIFSGQREVKNRPAANMVQRIIVETWSNGPSRDCPTGWPRHPWRKLFPSSLKIVLFFSLVAAKKLLTTVCFGDFQTYVPQKQSCILICCQRCVHFPVLVHL